MNRVGKLKWSRRRLLQCIGVVSGGLLTGAGCEQEQEAGPETSGAVEHTGTRLLDRAIREHFSYLKIDSEITLAFAKDLIRHQGAWNPTTSPRPFTRFLASTDFFQNGADESRPLRYVTYYDPYVSNCYNPFDTST